MDWLNALLLLVLVAGHTELLITIVNRTHGLPIHVGPLRHFRHLDDLMIPLFPVLLLWRVGLGGPGLLVGGSWHELSLGWTIYLTICGCGAAGIVWSAARWWLQKVPAQQTSQHSRILKIDESLGDRPFGPGPYSYLTKVPFNEILQVEFNEKTFQLDRIPAAWDGLSILHLSDFHFSGSLRKPFYDRVILECEAMQYDLVVFSGDLLDDVALLEWLPSTLGKLDARLGKYFILGNHDWTLSPDRSRAVFQEHGWQDASGEVHAIEHRDHALLVAGTERPWMGRQPDFSKVDASGFRLLLSHTPDQLPWARSQQVDLMLAGHNHGGQVVLPIIGPVYAPSQFGVKHVGGTFWDPPTLMHVSRGLAGKHPLRWRCRPEVTRIVLTHGTSEP
ncbi:MAG: metallophosphoesterase [Planctomycetota bacterium]|nr:metallophosphoesterase [Planctomycetota bacterium]